MDSSPQEIENLKQQVKSGAISLEQAVAQLAGFSPEEAAAYRQKQDEILRQYVAAKKASATTEQLQQISNSGDALLLAQRQRYKQAFQLLVPPEELARIQTDAHALSGHGIISLAEAAIPSTAASKALIDFRRIIAGYKEAGATKRMVALYLDVIIWALLPIFATNSINGGTTPGYGLLIFFLGYPVYIAVFDGFLSFTPAELIFNLRVINDPSGGKIGLWKGLKRGLALASIFPLSGWLFITFSSAGKKKPGESSFFMDRWSHSATIDKGKPDPRPTSAI